MVRTEIIGYKMNHTIMTSPQF